MTSAALRFLCPVLLLAAALCAGCSQPAPPSDAALPPQCPPPLQLAALPDIDQLRQAPPADPADIRRTMNAAIQCSSQLRQYRAIFQKQERLAGILRPLELACLTIREHAPFSVRMTWFGHAERGKDIIFVDGWNNGLMKVYTGNMIFHGPWNISPTADTVLRQNRKPITMAGLRSLAQLLLRADDEPADAAPEAFRDLGRFQPQETLGDALAAADTPLLRLLARPYHQASSFSGDWLVFGIDPVTNLVVLNLHLDQAGNLVALYHYLQLQLDAQVSDADFDPATLGKR